MLTVKNVLLLGEYLHRAYYGRYYAKAQNLRPGLRRTCGDALERYDVHAMPTSPHSPRPIPGPDASFDEYVDPALDMLSNTPQFNATSHPAISAPCGLVDDLHVGLMLVGRHFDDLTVLRVADPLEAAGDWQFF